MSNHYTYTWEITRQCNSQQDACFFYNSCQFINTCPLSLLVITPNSPVDNLVSTSSIVLSHALYDRVNQWCPNLGLFFHQMPFTDLMPFNVGSKINPEPQPIQLFDIDFKLPLPSQRLYLMMSMLYETLHWLIYLFIIWNITSTDLFIHDMKYSICRSVDYMN